MRVMLRRIDMVGPPGVGKTTLWRTLVRTRGGRRVWRTVEELATMCARRVLREEGDRRKQLFMAVFGEWPLVGRVVTNHVIRNESTALEWFAGEYGDFLALAREAAGEGDKSEYRKTLGQHRFLSQMLRWAVLLRWAPPEVVVSDESISQKMFNVLPWSEQGIALADVYARAMPPPAALVVVTGTTELITERIIQRQRAGGKIIPGHVGLDRAHLRALTDVKVAMVERLKEAVQESGVPVFETRVSVGTPYDPELVHQFIRSVADESPV